MFGNLPRAGIRFGAASESPCAPPPFPALPRCLHVVRMLCWYSEWCWVRTGVGRGDLLPSSLSRIVTHPLLTSSIDSRRSLDTFIRPFLGALICPKALEQGWRVSLHPSSLFLPLFWSRLLSFPVKSYINGDKWMLVRVGARQEIISHSSR